MKDRIRKECGYKDFPVYPNDSLNKTYGICAEDFDEFICKILETQGVLDNDEKRYFFNSLPSKYEHLTLIVLVGRIHSFLEERKQSYN